ncbi:transcriptional regulator [Paenibacillus sp. PCH8]|uniref:transcriptional regulator n=1 Tax=Paenibacillus sp. PCH8 TaxID=2066524 RepID=UPI000CF9082F|nr:transcriptional regulator [Paenibacillus sp. PCH8]PQP84525.1 transcriptional regulator [Paenibacillus sp. PCH8]
MKSVATIRDHLADYLKTNHMTLNQFSEISGINSGTLSGTLNGLRPIGMQQLDRLTAGMGLTEGYFYELYIHECFVHTSPDWRRLGPFLYRCAELGKVDYMEEAINLIMDNISYTPLLFELAEQLYREGRLEAAKPLYLCVAEGEKMQHSERLALSQYRLFTIGLSKDQLSNLTLATQFEFFVDRLDEPYQLDGLNDLINVYASLRRWDKLLVLGEKLKLKATIHYESHGNIKPKEVRKEIIFYILYSYLVMGSACFYLENYKAALDYVTRYIEHSWVESPSHAEQVVIQQFKEWAEANRFMYMLRDKQVHVLSDYLEYISNKENEFFPAICEILVAANEFDLDIDCVLVQYESLILYQEQSSRIGKISSQLTGDRHTRLLMELSKYYLNKKNYDKGFKALLDSLFFSLEIKSGLTMLKCVGIFEKYRRYASDTVTLQYQNLIGEVSNLNEKKISFVYSDL